MTTEIEPTSHTGPTAPPKNKGGRPKKVDPLQLISELQKQLAAMASTILAQGATIRDNAVATAKAATLAPVPSASADLLPGTYVQRGIDSSGAPILGKVRWTAQAIKDTYEAVTFTPLREMTVGPHGVMYRVEAGIETTVPKIVKDFYDTAIRQEKDEQIKTRPMSANERAELDARAMESPGRHMSRLSKVGNGLNVQLPDGASTETTAP